MELAVNITAYLDKYICYSNFREGISALSGVNDFIACEWVAYSDWGFDVLHI